MAPLGTPKIIYTRVDEAPALATYSLLPILQAFMKAADIELEIRDISLAGRILAQFADRLLADQVVSDDLHHLGMLATKPEANIVKLPNISASMPQLNAAIEELQNKGYAIPDYPYEPKSDEERVIRDLYDRVKGSAVNPVLRMGNSDRRAPPSVKTYARTHPHPMGSWSAESASHVATMSSGDLRHNEVSTTVVEADTGPARIEHIAINGAVTVLKDGVDLEAEEVIDVSTMSRLSLRTFLVEQYRDAKVKGVLFSVHLKATMMKVSDPILFGHVVSTYFADIFDMYQDTFRELDVNPNEGLAALFRKLEELPEVKQQEIENAIRAAIADGPDLAMVDSEKGITNLHVPSDVIIDASMPAAIRSSGKMWNSEGALQDTKFVIPDSSYAGVYQVVIDDCKANGSYDPVTMGSVPNVGLMARKAEEYGSHDKTFEIKETGRVRVVANSGSTLLEQPVEAGDLYRMSQTKDDAIRDWVDLAVRRGSTTGAPIVFWLDKDRPHDNELIRKVDTYLKEHGTQELDVHILSPVGATLLSCKRIRQGLDTIAVTGNVLRDYLTDLFPILEVGTSAKMLSVVPLMAGGGLFETGAGGSAPKHVQQFLKEGHLRWDSLGEFLALAASLEHLAEVFGTLLAKVLAASLDRANARYLNDNRGPSRKVNEIDTRGSHYFLARYWAEELASQEEDTDLGFRFGVLADKLGAQGVTIESELLAAQGSPVDLGGYYMPDQTKAVRSMRPSPTLNAALQELKEA
jgi:isocitrate dehydrogenase